MKKRIKYDRIIVSEDTIRLSQKVRIYLTIWSRIKLLFTGIKEFEITHKQMVEQPRGNTQDYKISTRISKGLF
jgi:hypothetical protein